MSEYLPVPPDPWVATATNRETHRLPDDSMAAIAASPELSNTIDGIVGAVARGNDGSEYRIVACALRPDASGVWGVIQDVNHVPTYIESVTQNASSVIVEFVSGVKTVAVLVTPDETMAMSGLTAGASVAPDAATIRMSWSVTGDRVYWNGSAWTSTNNSFSAYSFNATTGVLTCQRRGTFVANTSVVAASRKPGTHVFVDGVNLSQIRIGFADMAGNPITTPSAECDAYLVGPMRASSTIDPSTITSAEYALANLWLLGIVQTSS